MFFCAQEEFKSGQENSEDDEDTLEEQEKHEKSTEHEQELKELQAEGQFCCCPANIQLISLPPVFESRCGHI